MRGYSGLGRQILDPEAPPDWKESFMLGRDLGPDHPLVRRGVPFEGPNPWPRDLPGFRAQMEAYTGEMIRLGRALTTLLARSLGLEPDALAEISEEPNCSVRLLRYPAPEAGSADNQLGSGAHTDWGLFTLLLQDDEGGLEILGGDGVWAPAPPRPGALVVNLGDMVPHLTNGRYASNLHRVRRRPGDADRYSVACFFNPNAEYRFASLKVCLRPGEAADPPLSFAEHVRRRAAETAAPP